MIEEYPEVIVTNYETLQFFKPEFKLTIDMKMIDALTALNGGKFITVGYFNEIPVIAYKTWHEDDHFLIHIKDAIVTDDQIASDSSHQPDEGWDKFLVLH
jgi:hypothetical protein